MKFFFPDSQDLVSPTYDFIHDEYSPIRIRQRDDRYAHEVLETPPYHGLLVSKAIVDGSVDGSGKYTAPQRARLYRLGVRSFFRLPPTVETLGDNGAFNYERLPVPPVTVDETLDFYEGCGFDAGVSVDHVILGYDRGNTEPSKMAAWKQRRQLTLRLAEEFMSRLKDRQSRLQPVGAAQGWSPASYAESVRQLQEMGYERIALGGMVPLETHEILECLHAIDGVRQPDTQLHLLGITRVECMDEFAALGIASFDSTSVFLQAFKSDHHNYHTADRTYVAIRVPQVDGNPKLRRRILAGIVSQREAIEAERATLKALRAYDGTAKSRTEALSALSHYEAVCLTEKSYIAAYEETLEARPWARCRCGLCDKHGVEIALFRGTERNKRRGFHNMAVLAERMAALETTILGSSRG